MNWYYVDGPHRVGPVPETEWEELVRNGKIQPETLVWTEGKANWIPFRDLVPPPLPEPEEVENEPQPEPPELPEVFAARVRGRDYKVRIWSTLGRAGQLLWAHPMLMVSSMMIVISVALLGLGVPVMAYAIQVAFGGPLVAGLVNVYLRLMRQGSSSMSDLYAGFRRPAFSQLACQSALVFTLNQLFLIPFRIASHVTKIHIDQLDTVEKMQAVDPMALLVCMLVFLTCMIPTVYFAFCWMFSIPLIFDKRMKFWPAMQLSREKVLQHPWLISWWSVAAGIVGSAGFFLAVIGMVFTLPLYFASMLYLYEDIFGEPQEQPVSVPELEEAD